MKPLAAALVGVLWLPLNALQLLATLLWSAFWISVALAVALLSRRRGPALWLARHVWAPGMVAIGLSRLRVVGRERLDFRRGYFFAANHQSWLDIPVRPERGGALRGGARVPPRPCRASRRGCRACLHR